MTNAGDLANAIAENRQFQKAAAALALELGMSRTYAAFALPTATLEKRYFDLLPGIAAEIEGWKQESE